MSNPSQAGRAIVSRFFFGVTSIGAALGLLYLYYNYQRRKDAATSSESESDSTTSKRKRRVASGSGENKNRVTFSEQNEIIGFEVPGPSSGKEEDEDVLLGEVSKAMSSPQRQPSSSRNEKSWEDPIGPDLRAEGFPSPKKSVEDQLEIGEPIEEKVTLSHSTSYEAPPVVVIEDDKVNVPETQAAVPLVEPQSEKDMNTIEEPIIKASNGHSSLQQQTPNSVDIITPETDYDRDSMVREMNIPRDIVSGLIGKRGVNIKSIQHNSNTMINFRDETLENGDRICYIRGRAQDVALAEAMIEKYVIEQPLITTVTISVPLSSVGRIIGKGGESIRGIQDRSNARVTVDSGINHYRGGDGNGATRAVTIKGTEDQIAIARQMVIEKVEEEKTLRRNIDMATQNRTPRRPASNSSGASMAHPNSGINGNLPIQTNGVMEVFVSCAYHPNDFWIQVMGRESIELDKLAEDMTEWYSQLPPNADEEDLSVGDLIAAPFDVDGKMYRGKIIKLLADNEAEVIYVDYGDKRVLNRTVIRRIHPEYLLLRFQAIPATLNLGCIGDRWTDDIIGEFCDLTYCAQWQALTAKVNNYLKDPVDGKDIVWVELIDKNLNIGDELIRQNKALPKEILAVSTVKASSNSKKSYASVVADELKPSNSDSVEYDAATGEEVWGDEQNGN